METINGYTIIASHTTRHGDRIILGVRRHVRPGHPDDVEYVTARAELGPVTSWSIGHYFGIGGTGTESSHFLDATNDFCQRAGIVFEEA